MHGQADRRELPPTAGLPLRVQDLLPGRGKPLAGALRSLLGTNDSWVTCSGTAALVVALTALSQHSRRHEVIVPAWTCPLVAIAVAHCGLRVRPCDLARDRIDMDPQMLARLCGPSTLAIVPTHLGGRVADVNRAMACAATCGAWVIEDAAQALGARHPDGTAAGALGDIGIFSLAAGKGLSIYEGGLLTTRRLDLHAALQHAADTLLPRRFGWELRRCTELMGYTALYNPGGLRLAYGRRLRRNLRRGDVVDAVGDRFPLRIPLHRISHWRESVAARAATRLPGFLRTLHDTAQRRLPRLRGIEGVHVIEDAPGVHGTWPFFLLLLPDHSCRDAALERLWTRGLGVSRLFIHALPDYAYLRGVIDDADVPNARDIAARSLTLGNSPWLDDDDFARVADTLESVLAQRYQPSESRGDPSPGMDDPAGRGQPTDVDAASRVASSRVFN